MFREISKLVIYRKLEKDNILFALADICEEFYSGDYVKEDLITKIYIEINKVIKGC